MVTTKRIQPPNRMLVGEHWGNKGDRVHKEHRGGEFGFPRSEISTYYLNLSYLRSGLSGFSVAITLYPPGRSSKELCGLTKFTESRIITEMTEEESKKQGFPFHPLEDFVLGEVLGKTLERLGIPKQKSEEAILSHLPEGVSQFFFTPNSKKQILLQSIPVELRGFLDAGKDKEILGLFRKTIREEGRLDLALELIEWIFTGFGREDLVRSLFSLILNDKFALPENFFSILQEEYEKEMLDDLDKFRKE